MSSTEIPKEPFAGAFSLQSAGAKRRSGTKKPVKKETKKPTTKGTKTSARKLSSDNKDKSSKSKKGGSFVSDVQNLAVPFAILLAKEGLSKVFKKDTKDTKTTKSTSSLSAKSASRPASTRRRSTLSGGSCNLGCGALTGGRAARELFQLQKEIDHFLEKY
jgi:hypothetical protein